ncbi:MAG: hypothetical protein A2W25_12800 [candidate division Zixibacteria bacterium RBG_16_53_22]|nr:MAG: hypothetical protein A2W25_12800 [candidate division Zixibacteria bacterium RBG_16_53_22]
MADYKTSFNCPGCGSSLLTLEGAISMQCVFCGLVMRIGAPGRILKYYYPSDLDNFALKCAVEKHLRDNGRLSTVALDTTRLYFLPFYRFRGMSYSLMSEKKYEDDEIELDQAVIPSKTIFHQRCRHFDLTIPAFENKAFGLESLGVRPEVIPLSVFAKDILLPRSIPLGIRVSPDDAKQSAMGMFAFNLGFALEGKEHVISEMIGEGLSIIYYPVWALSATVGGMPVTYFIDGLSKRIINETSEPFEDRSGETGLVIGDEFKPIPHRCPNCGADLPVSEFSLIYYCRNCHKSYIVVSDGYRLTKTRSALHEQGKDYFPYWRFQFKGGRGESSVGEFAKILTGEIPLIAKNKAKNAFYLYVPAFKMPDLDNMTTRAIRLCRTQPRLELSEDEITPAADMILPECEAVELARFYWQVIRSRYRYLNIPDYVFTQGSLVGQGELLWLTMTDSTGPAKSRVGKSSISAR